MTASTGSYMSDLLSSTSLITADESIDNFIIGILICPMLKILEGERFYIDGIHLHAYSHYTQNYVGFMDI